jgi:hypothetical protein
MSVASFALLVAGVAKGFPGRRHFPGMWIAYALFAAARFVPTPADDAAIRGFIRNHYSTAPLHDQVWSEPTVWSERIRLPVGIISIHMRSRDVAEVHAVQTEVGSTSWGRREFWILLRRVGESWTLDRELIPRRRQLIDDLPPYRPHFL